MGDFLGGRQRCSKEYRKVQGADPSTFEILLNQDGAVLARDKQKVFWRGVEVPGAKPGDLRIFSNWAADDRRIYYAFHVGGSSTTLDPKTFRPVSLKQYPYLAEDKDGVYNLNGTPFRRLDLISKETFKTISEGRTPNGRRYNAFDKNFYYLFDMAYGVGVVEPVKVDARFKWLGCGYHVFDKNLYFNFMEMKNVDISAFYVVGVDPERSRTADTGDCGGSYGLDSTHQYFEEKLLAGDAEWVRYRKKEIRRLRADRNL